MDRSIANKSARYSVRARRAKADVCKEKRYLRMFFEVHIVPRDPDGHKITPITIKREESLGPDVYTSDPEEQKRINFITYEAAYHDLLKQATDLKADLLKRYKGKNYSIYIISKRFKN